MKRRRICGPSSCRPPDAIVIGSGAEALIELSTQHRLSRIDLLLGDWLDRKGLGD